MAPATSLPALILAFGNVSELETAIGITFLAQRTCRLADRAGSKEAGWPTPVHASIVSSVNGILNRLMLEISMGLKDNLVVRATACGETRYLVIVHFPQDLRPEKPENRQQKARTFCMRA